MPNNAVTTAICLGDHGGASLSVYWHGTAVNARSGNNNNAHGTVVYVYATRVVMLDTVAHRSWIDAILSTITSRSSSGSLVVKVLGSVPESWVRYMDGKDGVQAYRVAADGVDGSDVEGGGPAAVVALFASLGVGLLPAVGGNDDDDDDDDDVGGGDRRLGDVVIERVALAGAAPSPPTRPTTRPTPTMVDAATAEGLGIGDVAGRLVGMCVTGGGKKRMRAWVSFSALTEGERASRLDAVEGLVARRDVLGSIQRVLKRVGSSSHAHAVEAMWRNQTLPKPDRASNYLKLAKALGSLEDLHGVGGAAAGGIGGLSEEAAAAVARARFLIETVLDEAQFPDGMCVRFGVCPQLDELKAAHFGMDGMMTRILAHERSRIPRDMLRGASAVFAWTLVHVASVGVFVHVPEGLIPPYLEDVLTDWALAFEPGCLQRDLPGGLYVSDACRALNERYGNIMLEIMDREAAICNQLTDKLLQMRDQLSSAFDVVADLDCLCALAQFAAEQGMCRPAFSEGELIVQGGWSPLLRAGSALGSTLGGAGIIPNDVQLGDRGKTVVVMGGPGTGKGVYLSLVGIVCFLARMGSFVPATLAVVPEIDRIFSLSAYGESIRDSSFSAGIRIVSEMLRWGTAKSLFLLEPFGSATVSCDGVALAAAVVRDLSRTNGMAIFATHMRSCLLDALRGLDDDDDDDDGGGEAGEGGQGVSGRFFRTMHLATVEHGGTRVPLYALREGAGAGDGDGDGGEDLLRAVGDADFASRVREVRAAMGGTSPTCLDRDGRFSMRQALEVVGRLREGAGE